MKPKSRRSLLLLVMLTVFLSAVLGVGTMAYFTSQSTTPAESGKFMAGRLVIGSNFEGSDQPLRLNPVTIANLQPGGPAQTGIITVKNLGTLPAKLYRMTCEFPNNEAPSLARVLNMKVWIDKGTSSEQLVYNGKFDLMTADHGVIYFNPVIIYNPGQTRDITLEVTMDASAGNEYQGVRAENVVFTVYAKQVEDLIAGEEPGNVWNPTVIGTTGHFAVKVTEGAAFGHQMAIDIDPTDPTIYPSTYPQTFERYDRIHITKRTPDGATVEMGWALVRWHRIWIFRYGEYVAGWQLEGVEDHLGSGVTVAALPVHGIAVFDGLEPGSYAIKTDIDYRDSLGRNLSETTGWLQYLYSYNE